MLSLPLQVDAVVQALQPVYYVCVCVRTVTLHSSNIIFGGVYHPLVAYSGAVGWTSELRSRYRGLDSRLERGCEISSLHDATGCHTGCTV